MSVYEKMTALADAIRSKTGGTEKLTLDQMATEVNGLQVGGGGEEWFNDGDTHIWISLPEGRTSPMLGVGPNGTVTVDWGDGTEPDVLTGTSVSTVKFTPNHEYAKPGDYVIRLTIDGEMGLTGDSNGSYILRCVPERDNRNYAYNNAVQRVEIGAGVTSIGGYTFQNCQSLTSVSIPDSVTSIGDRAFGSCYSLASVSIPDMVTSIGTHAFYGCYTLSSITIPNGITSIGDQTFYNCYSLSSITIPNSVTTIGGYAFYNCYSLSSIMIPNSVTSFGNLAFFCCYGVRFYDFSNYTTVPTLSNANTFVNIPADCEIRVPAALYDEWKAATNWTTHASKIVAV